MNSNDHKTVLYNKHLLIETGQGKILIDTGSPASFHDDGFIEINGRKHKVSSSYNGVTASYVSQKVGCRISGLLGMDIMSLYEVHIDVRPVSHAFGAVLFFDTDESKPVPNKNIMGIPLVDAFINGKSIQLLFDTGAPISYIDRTHSQCVPVCETVGDFSPLLGDGEYEVERHILSTIFSEVYGRDNEVEISYGDMPEQITMLLNMLNVDGIIGYDLMENYRLVINRGHLYFPPQGI